MDVTQTMLEANAWQAVLRILLSALIGLGAYFLVRPREVKSSLDSGRRWATFALYGCAGLATTWRWEATLFFVLLLPSLAAIGGVLWGRFRGGLPVGFDMPFARRGMELWSGAPGRARAGAAIAGVVILGVVAYGVYPQAAPEELSVWQQWQNYDRCIIREGQKVSPELLGYVKRECFAAHAASVNGWQLATGVALTSFHAYLQDRAKHPASGTVSAIANEYWMDHLQRAVHPDAQFYSQQVFLQWVAYNEQHFEKMRREAASRP